MRLLPLLLISVIACGDDGVRHTPDAAPHDGPVSHDAPDYDAPDAAPSPVTIAVTAGGTPQAGVHVYFQNADSTLVLATTTDATGTASAVMPAGGFVTAVDPFAALALAGGQHELETFSGVKPGDHLLIQQAGGGASIQVTVQAPLDAAASSYQVFSPCNSDGTSISALPPSVIGINPSGTMTLSSCGAATDFLVVSYDQNNQPLNYLYATNVPVADQGTVDLTGATYVGTTTRTLTFNNPTTSLFIEDDLIDPEGKIYAYLNETPSDATMPVITEAAPSFTGAGVLLRTSLIGGIETQTLLDWGAYSNAFTTDVASRMLPTYQGTPGFDPFTHKAVMTESATGVTPDFTVIGVAASRTSDSTSWVWLEAAPYATTVYLPVLPTDLYDFNIAATDSASVDGWATGKVPGGYDAVRSTIFGMADLAVFATGPSGSATLAEWSQPPTARTAAVFRKPRVLAHRLR